MEIENGGDSFIDVSSTPKNPSTIDAQAIDSNKEPKSPESSTKYKPKGRPKGSKNYRTIQRERWNQLEKEAGDRNGGAKANGRPPVMKYDARQDLKNAAKDFSNEAIYTLVKIMRDKNNSATNRMAAAAMILDRGHGKAVNQTEVSIGVYDRYSNEDLIKFITGQAPNLIDVTPTKKDGAQN
jgi:hypothetical protein